MIDKTCTSCRGLYLPGMHVELCRGLYLPGMHVELLCRYG